MTRLQYGSGEADGEAFSAELAAYESGLARRAKGLVVPVADVAELADGLHGIGDAAGNEPAGERAAGDLRVNHNELWLPCCLVDREEPRRHHPVSLDMRERHLAVLVRGEVDDVAGRR